MWAPCCSWSCMDSDLVEDSIQTCTSQPGPSCKACGRLLDSPARKHVCVDCKKSYCGGCSVEMEFRPRLCHTCQLFYGNLLERAELMRLKVKDLRDYLHLHEVPTQLCREKEELVELVLVQQTPSSDGFSPQIPPTRTTSFPATVIYTEAVSAEIPPTQAASPEAPPSQAASTEAQPQHAASSESPPPQAASAEAPPPQVAHAEAPPPQAAYTGTVPQDAGQSDSESETDHQTGHELQSSDTEEFLTSGRRASLSDLSNVEDVEALSVRQLKEILARNFVNYKGCCEKWELMERVRRLYQEHKELQNQEELPAGRGEDLLCKICMDAPIDCVLLECGHMVTCTKCGKRMNECPICRQYVVRAVHVFRS